MSLPSAMRSLRPLAVQLRQNPRPCFSFTTRISITADSPRLKSTFTASKFRRMPSYGKVPGFTLSPPQAPASHYKLFPKTLPHGPPPRSPFTIDPWSLKSEFLQLQAKAHPDLHPGPDKKKAEALSSNINEAYKTLSDPLRRAQYLLSLRGIETAEDETAKVDDAELLTEVLEAREQIEEAEKEEDLAELHKKYNKKIAQNIQELKKAFEKDDLDIAKQVVVRMRYFVNIEESIRAWEKGEPVVLQH